MLGQSAASSQPPTQAQSTPLPSAAVTPKPLQQKQVKAYFTDENEMKLIEKEVTVSYEKEDGVYAALLQAQAKGDDPKAATLFEDMKFQKVVFDQAKGELTIDIQFGPNSQLGAPGEELFLQALKKSMFQFPEVKALFVLKDGKQVDSLMGHMELPYPIKRSNEMN
ncbi:GerMN domain-containing protein [Paenibacillus hexagrammi]|uniref:GerMN domain-containing protein n=1 Tax=Paenibacillus hexagrammi TaxID=2908839 RepID=A0ABY3ST13_9BACL|nr:GerMN domain-containing protein [Paenibacillus sp. YPD9-1]UJF36117.1 GerMN domain-containing protein [Paenibacillus sp. YPD9-1]